MCGPTVVFVDETNSYGQSPQNLQMLVTRDSITAQNIPKSNFLSLYTVDESALVCAGILFSKANISLLGFHRGHALFLLNCLFVEEQLKLKLSFSTNRILFQVLWYIESHTQKRKTWCCLNLRSKQDTASGSKKLKNSYGNPNSWVTSMSLQHT